MQQQSRAALDLYLRPAGRERLIEHLERLRDEGRLERLELDGNLIRIAGPAEQVERIFGCWVEPLRWPDSELRRVDGGWPATRIVGRAELPGFDDCIDAIEPAGHWPMKVAAA